MRVDEGGRECYRAWSGRGEGRRFGSAHTEQLPPALIVLQLTRGERRETRHERRGTRRCCCQQRQRLPKSGHVTRVCCCRRCCCHCVCASACVCIRWIRSPVSPFWHAHCMRALFKRSTHMRSFSMRHPSPLPAPFSSPAHACSCCQLIPLCASIENFHCPRCQMRGNFAVSHRDAFHRPRAVSLGVSRLAAPSPLASGFPFARRNLHKWPPTALRPPITNHLQNGSAKF